MKPKSGAAMKPEWREPTGSSIVAMLKYQNFVLKIPIDSLDKKPATGKITRFDNSHV